MTFSRNERPIGTTDALGAGGETIPADPGSDGRERDIERLVDALGDPTRRSAYFAVARADEPQSKADVAGALGIERRLAGFHLDKLVARGFLEADFKRPEGRSGPGAGRPAKLYRTAATELSVEFPVRHYELLASLLARALADDDSSLEAIGYDFGLQAGLDELAAGADAPDPAVPRERLVRLLSRFGYEARAEGDDGVRACNCPFEDVALREPERICGLDRAIWRGMLAAFAPEARLEKPTARALGDVACTASVAAGSSLDADGPR